MGFRVPYLNTNDDRGPSPSVFKDFIVRMSQPVPGTGAGTMNGDALLFFDDFEKGAVFASTTAQDGWYPYIDSSGAITQVSSDGLGVLKFGCPATQDKEVALTSGSNVAYLATINGTAGSRKSMAFEARVNWAEVASQSSFIGLATLGLPADSLLADAGTGIASQNLLGFQLLEADPDGVDAVHADTSAVATVKDVAHTITASAWVKLGVAYHAADNAVRWYVDGVQVGSDVLPTATNFPDQAGLAILIAHKTHEGVAKTLNVDWVCCTVAASATH